LAGRNRCPKPEPRVAGIELLRRIRKGQFNLGRLRLEDGRAPAVWNAILAA
jgi:hypothetical protein